MASTYAEQSTSDIAKNTSIDVRTGSYPEKEERRDDE
jgi:hypothetical protein